MIDSLYFFSWLLPDSFSLYVYYRYVYSPCCCSCNRQKIMVKKSCFTILLRTFFKKKKTKIKFFLKDLPFLFCSILFHSRKAFLRTNTCFIRFIAEYLSLSYKNSSVFWKWISLDFLWFSWLKFFHPFFVTFCFCSSRFAFTSFFISFYVWSLIFFISLLLELSFFEQQFPLPFVKKLFNFSFISCMRYLCMTICSWICSSVVSFSLFVFYRFYHICFPFPFVFSLHNLSERKVCGTVAKQKKLVCLIPFLLVTFFIFICLYMFFSAISFLCFILMCFWTFFFLSSRSWMSFPLSLPFLCVSFSEDPVWFDHPFSFLFSFSPFTYSPCSQECLMEISKASRSPAWSIPVTVRVKRTWMTWGWSEAQQANVTKRQRQNKDESWIKSFSLSLTSL